MLTVGEAQYHELRSHGEEAYPHESCGVLLGRADGVGRHVTRAVRCANAHADSPRNRYQIDPRELLRIEREARVRGEEVVGFYHSHPDHPARPSGTDLAEAHWLGCSYVITRVVGGKAEATGSFLLQGEGEDAKRFSDEEIRITPGGDS
jgi:proteasome lid subunit RPN8/RPN11